MSSSSPTSPKNGKSLSKQNNFFLKQGSIIIDSDEEDNDLETVASHPIIPLRSVDDKSKMALEEDGSENDDDGSEVPDLEDDKQTKTTSKGFLQGLFGSKSSENTGVSESSNQVKRTSLHKYSSTVTDESMDETKKQQKGVLSMLGITDLKNDPYITIRFDKSKGKSKLRTETHWDAGERSEWEMDGSDSKWQILLSYDEMTDSSHKFHLTVKDDNRTSRTQLIGEGEIPFHDFIKQSNKDSQGLGKIQTLEFPLSNNKKDVPYAGKAVFTYSIVNDHYMLNKYNKPKFLNTNSIFHKAILFIRKIEITNLKAEGNSSLFKSVFQKKSQLHLMVNFSFEKKNQLWKDVKSSNSNSTAPSTSTTTSIHLSDSPTKSPSNDVPLKLSKPLHDVTNWNPVTKLSETTFPEKNHFTWNIFNPYDPNWNVAVEFQDVFKDSLKILVQDESRSEIGAVKLPLKSLCDAGVNGGMVELEGDLLSTDTGATVGKIKVCTHLFESDSSGKQRYQGADANTNILSTQNLSSFTYLCIHKIEAADLMNVETLQPVLLSNIRRKSKECENPEDHPVVMRVRNNDMINLSLTMVFLATLLWWLHSLVAYLVGILLEFLPFLSGGSQTCHRKESPVPVILKTVGLTFLLSLFAHRIFAYIVAFVLRTVLSRLVAKDRGSYDIHIGWLSIRGLFDKFEVVFRDVVFLNHPKFHKTPYWINLKELSCNLNPLSIIDTIKGGPLVLDRAIVDCIEIYFERSDDPKEVYPLNIWAAIGITDSNAAIKAVFWKIVNKIKKKMNPTNLFAAKEDEIDSGDGSLKKKKEFTMEVNRLVVFDVLAHPLDILAAYHMEASTATDIHLKEIILHHEELTDPPKERGGPREAVLGDKFGDIMGNKIAEVLFTTNPTRIAALLSATSANNVASAFVVK